MVPPPPDLRFERTGIPGAWLFVPRIHRAPRGSFHRLYDARSCADAGFATSGRQVSVAHTARRGTVRGLHYQWPPHAETKLVRCVRGATHEPATGVRFDDPAFGIELPRRVSLIGDRDRHFPDFENARAVDEPHDQRPDGVA